MKKQKKSSLEIDKTAQQLIVTKILDLQNSIFASDTPPLKVKHKDKFRKQAGNYRIIYPKENNLLIITRI